MGSLLHKVNAPVRYTFRQDLAEALLKDVPTHRSKPGEALVRPREEAVAFAVQLETYLAESVLTQAAVAGAGGFFEASLRVVLANTRVHAWWELMAEDIRANAWPGLPAASPELLRSTLTAFVRVYLLLRCREYAEVQRLGREAAKSDVALRASMKGSGKRAATAAEAKGAKSARTEL